MAESLRDKVQKALAQGWVVIYTDGGCINNPGPGGYGVVLLFKNHRKELSGGYQLTTNNRMELSACIEGLKALKKGSYVLLVTDSKYVLDSIQKGWVYRWRLNNWKLKSKKKAENIDLWEELLTLLDQHKVEWQWAKGHAGIEENERCDELANQAARQRTAKIDKGYVLSQSTKK